VGLLQLILRRSAVVPFGPFLCLGAAFVMVLWSEIWPRLRHLFEIGWLVPVGLLVCGVLLAALLTIVQGIKSLFHRRAPALPDEPPAAAGEAPLAASAAVADASSEPTAPAAEAQAE
jgi:hypothetical protein